ncbi:beta-lactamase regulator AmpE [Parashewanella spongiae]|uniref:Beta-lactamase regulator AmpE n=1 Tax=Parashewanella spongiae TaxID=342950 RepID=A0A3A6UL93_9GAMM|nr:beta-lactamase regulator AmpE [Parashewanella spongiae]MCL1077441.1 beta-lactamase regulator AmpE [Parashewanella spongiae]RJY18418.1 beta-lactamase regulator AmpE [Parashewanella spongiae]
MALFSLLIAIFAERMKFLPQNWQIASLLSQFQQRFIGSHSLSSPVFTVVALTFPAASIAVLLWLAQGVLFGAVTLLLWVGISVICLSHFHLRSTFKHFMQAACRGDVQACYHLSTELEGTCTKAVSESELGTTVGQSVAWINYRNYGAVAIYLIALGPVGAVFYSTLRFYSETAQKESIKPPFVSQLCFLLDWLPSRLFAFGYLLSGHFSHGLSTWLPLITKPATPARTIIVDTALASEVLPEKSTAPICIQSTIALLTLAKRSFILFVTLVSLLTIFGWLN